MKKALCILLLLWTAATAYGQDAPGRIHSGKLTPYDSLMLAGLPEMKAPATLKSSSLPYAVDNSVLPYYRPIYQQVSSECGQVSGVAYNFTYAINRLRELPANIAANQYPPHFSFNFMNGGYGWHGVSYFHSFEILKTLGCPDVLTYGGMSAGGDARWMDGYENYYTAMQNRVREVYQIQVGTEEGLLTLKHWLHNHLDGSETGGVASFYANAPWNLRTLPESSPEAGRSVITTWSGLPSHAMTIVGYNDSIRYDYNGDGLYTNHLDLNNDDTVDMRDWEIGGLLFADGWGSGIQFADSGKCYMMYRTLAQKVYEGGIWNHAVHVLDVREEYKPRLSAKIRLRHDRRGMLRIRCGIAPDTLSETPQNMLELPVFNFQGGSQYMQGGISLEENKTIEFGLDISPLLGYADPDGANRIFLEVEERDTNGWGAGQVLDFTVIDHKNDSAVYFCEQLLPMAINNDSISLTWIDIEQLSGGICISTSELPTAVTGEEYSMQMQAEGGTDPLQWKLLHVYQEEDQQESISPTGIFMEPDQYDYGNVMIPLPFSFPFYGEMMDTLYIHPDGFVMFENTNFPWPYLFDPELLIKQNKCIAPMLCQKLDMVPAFGHGIWVEAGSDEVIVRWRADIVQNNYSPEVEFALHLFPDGQIHIIHGEEFRGHMIEWSCGISNGDGQNYLIPELAAKQVVFSEDAVSITPMPLPEGMELSENGLFHGIPQEDFQHYPLRVSVEDDEHIIREKEFLFSSSGLGQEELPEATAVQARVYPNPFSDEVEIVFGEGLNGPLSCIVYDISGRAIAVLADRRECSYPIALRWGKDAAPGLYFIHWRAGSVRNTGKVICTAN